MMTDPAEPRRDDDEPTYTITDTQWGIINSALLAAISICSIHVPDMRDRMLHASLLMDEIVNGPDDDLDV